MDPLIEKHLELVIEANKTTNITRIASHDEAMILHVEDSLSGLEEVNAAPEGDYVDLGSGAGYPGIPLAILTGRKTLLVDSVQKKAAILSGFVKELGLIDQIDVWGRRIEELALEQQESFAVASARALAQTSCLLELASPLLIKGGRLVCYKANVSEEELQHALEVCPVVGMKLVSDRSFLLSDGETKRRIIVFEKAAKPKIKLPRRNGMAQKNPL